MTIKSQTTFICSDGQTFIDVNLAEKHERELVDKTQNLYDKWVKGSGILRKHCLDDRGLWQVNGEDANPDFGGHHYQPDLGVFEGNLSDVIRHAVNLEGFWTWGAGGNIRKVIVKKVGG